jgi:hypothetical protein
MCNNNNNGIDYGMGRTNVDTSNGIRYGVIPMQAVSQAWCDSSDMDFGTPHCPKCGNSADSLDSFGATFEDGFDDELYDCAKYEDVEYFCANCEYGFGSESAYPDECLGTYISDDEYKAYCGQDGDVFVTKSSYYTLCQYCSPCAPGAGYCVNPGNVKAYCLGLDFFENESDCPYPVYEVETGNLLFTPKQ